MADKPRCFVISPIGPEGSAVREHADDVFDFIIKPAIDECDVEAFRSDHLRVPGKITDQMFNAILQEDFCIAVVTGHNPNVFYELAIAQAAGKPVIVMIAKGEDLPFDIADLRSISYDLRHRALLTGTYKAELVDHIRNLQSQEWKAESLLTRYKASVDSELNREWMFVQSAAEYSNENWSRLISGASEELDMMGISLAGWKKIRGFDQQLSVLAAAGCRIRILLMDPDNPTLENRLNPTLDEVLPGDVRNTISTCIEYYKRVAATNDNIDLRTVRAGTVNLYVVRNDTEAIGIPYLFSERSSESPMWRCREGTRLYDLLGNEFESLWRINEGTAPRP